MSNFFGKVRSFADAHPVLSNLAVNLGILVLTEGMGNSVPKLTEQSGTVPEASPAVPAPTSPDIHPSEVSGKSPSEIHETATGKGLIPKGPDPQNGKGSYVDPITGRHRVLVHPEDAHAHVNNPAGERLGPNGSVVPNKSPEAHLPIRKDNQ